MKPADRMSPRVLWFGIKDGSWLERRDGPFSSMQWLEQKGPSPCSAGKTLIVIRL
jgi:hypothetical protein